MLNPRLSNKTALLIAVAIIGAAAGSGLTYELTKSDSRIIQTKDYRPPVNPPPSVKGDTSKENTEVPVGNIDRDFQSYINIKIVALGKLEKTTENSKYILVGDDNKSSLLIDASAVKGKIDAYLNESVKLTGTVKFIDIGNNKSSLGIQASAVAAR